MADDQHNQSDRPVTLTVRDINGLADRLGNRARSVIFKDMPEAANDMRTAARLCRHVTRTWVTTSVAVA
jgi:hypothetical protein